MLTSDGTSVQYIGSVRAGNMTDNFNEGHPGAVITQIATYANLSLLQRPNIILLMAGTNDMATSLNVTTAPDRLGSLIDQCHNACPDATILVAQLTPAAINSTQTNIDAFKPLIPALVEDRVWKGMKVLSVNMSSFVSLDDLVDGLHPNDGGYAKMATGWMEGLEEASGMGWITPPVTV
jgi:lysophospholipase L1-like esterase